MKILITGGSGLLGRCMTNLLNEINIEYITTYNSRPIDKGYKVNFESEKEIEDFLIEHKPTICINSIVQRLTDICEKDWNETKKVNIDIVDRLSKICNKLNIHLIHISTDYVFDGYSSPYTEHSEVNPLQNYGISKLISEKRMIANMKKELYTIIRVPVLYCDNIEYLDENAVTMIGRKVLNQIEKTTEDDYSIRRPVYIPDFCRFIYDIIKENKTGIYHFYNPKDKTTKYEMSKIIANYLEKPHSHISPSSNCNMANRPYDTELIDDKYNINNYNITQIKEGIEKSFKAWKHPNILKEGSDCFLMLDLDGTLLDTDYMHFEAYRDVLSNYAVDLSWENFESVINNGCIENMIKSFKLEDYYNEIKNKKLEYMLLNKNIKFIDGAEDFLNDLIKNNTNFVIVTNTSLKVVNHFKNILPTLNKIQNWVTREDYNKPKPNSESYKLALSRYYKNEDYIIGFENTLNGYKALQKIANITYFITNKTSYIYNTIKKEDIYLIQNYTHFYNN